MYQIRGHHLLRQIVVLQNGLNPELAAKAANALQRYSIEHSRLGIPMFFAEEATHGHMAIGIV